MERRFLASLSHPVKLEKRVGTDFPYCTGFAAVFYKDGDPDTEYQLYPDLVERIAPGAFDRAVREDDVRGLMNHDPNLLLGRTAAGTLKLSADATGLRYEI